MKVSKFFFATLLVSGVFASFSSVYAQENGNRDAENKIVRGPYETNRFGDNWFIGVAGGINLFEDGILSGEWQPRVAPAINVNVGKWFTPSVGARVGYLGLRANGWSNHQTVYATEFVEGKNFKEKVNFAYVYGDLMWNISNAFSGYKETRFWNVIPYVSTGLLHAYGVKGVDATNNQFSVGAGIYNTLRVSDRVNFTLDVRQMVFKGTFNGNKGGMAGMTSATFGIAVNLGRTNWKRATEVPEGYAPYKVSCINDLKADAERLANDNKKLAKNASALNNENDALKKENAALKAEQNKRKPALDVTSAAVFFNIGETTLDAQNLFNLDFYYQNVIAQDDNKVIVLTGYADKQTGSKKRNQQLSEKRAQYVYDILRNKYNVPAERIQVKAVGSESEFVKTPAQLNRSVVLE